MCTLLSARRWLAVVLVLTLAPAFVVWCSRQAVADEGKPTVEKNEYKGWKNCLRISNGAAELIVTLDVGPRVISYRLADGKNVFKEYADQLGKTGESDWQIRGGHRLWVGPEDLTRTYAPDNGAVRYQELGSGSPGVRLIPAVETEYGIQKEIDLTLSPQGSAVAVMHRITNVGDKPTDLAPWALTVMAPGGVEIIPLPPKHPHPGPPKNARSPKDYAPDLFLSLWPFTDFKDPRWNFGSRYITLRHDANRGPTKLGVAHRMGWVGYLNGGTLFVKRFGYQEDKHYPDHGCNFETFSNQDMQEIESLGPIVRLGPGEKTELAEKWELLPNVDDFKDDAEIDRNVVSKISKK